uniref:Uncharacterized protein LOC105643779 n=1 Tax=Rhizophora mucronata TaxID=61149 RepID=A0A2P2LVQ3_RHIMU
MKLMGCRNHCTSRTPFSSFADINHDPPWKKKKHKQTKDKADNKGYGGQTFLLPNPKQSKNRTNKKRKKARERKLPFLVLLFFFLLVAFCLNYLSKSRKQNKKFETKFLKCNLCCIITHEKPWVELEIEQCRAMQSSAEQCRAMYTTVYRLQHDNY